jgi:hypothetical protein
MSANRCQTHHDPIPSFRAREAESSDRSGRAWSRPTLFGSARRAVQRANSGCTGRLATQFARRAPPDHGSRRLNGSFANGLGPFDAHRLGAGGNGLVQYVFRSPARIQTVRSSPRGPRAAPPNEKRSSLCYTRIFSVSVIFQTRLQRFAKVLFNDPPRPRSGRLRLSGGRRAVPFRGSGSNGTESAIQQKPKAGWFSPSRVGYSRSGWISAGPLAGQEVSRSDIPPEAGFGRKPVDG